MNTVVGMEICPTGLLVESSTNRIMVVKRRKLSRDTRCMKINREDSQSISSTVVVIFTCTCIEIEKMRLQGLFLSSLSSLLNIDASLG